VKLVHVVPTYEPAFRYGGTIRAVAGLCRGLARIGHDVTVVTTDCDGAGALDVPLDRAVTREGVRVRYCRGGRPRRLYRSSAMARALGDLVPVADLVHVHAVFLWPGFAAARAAERAGTPYFLSPHGMLERGLIERRSRFLKSAWIRLVERRTLARAAAIHVTSEAEAEAIRTLHLDLRPLVVVANGIDPVRVPDDGVLHDAWRDVRTGQRVLFLGRISWKKGLNDLVDAMATLPEATLVVAGNDDEGLLPTLLARVAGHGMEARVRFIGPVDDAAKWRLLAQADVMVMPSLFENFGIVVIEALAVGTPVIVARGVGVADFVARHGLGEVSETGPAPLAGSIRALLVDSGRRATIAVAAPRLVSDGYGWSGIARRMADAYRQVLDGERPSAQNV
jgi:glycosyltransferase involved in cell wall biosynthesis